MRFLRSGYGSILPVAVLVLVLGLVSSACATGPRGSQETWPGVDVLPEAPPADLDRDAATSTLRQGSDGFWYTVGGLSEGVTRGTPFLGRYSGDWPLRDVPRPALVFGHVLKRFEGGVALVHLDKRLPESEPGELEVTWESWPLVDGPGKGVGMVSEISPDFGAVTFTLGKEQGVQRGDLYGILRPAREGGDAQMAQLSRRMVGVCLVRETSTEGATCRMWRGHGAHQLRLVPERGDQVMFMEASFGKAPRQGRILVSAIEGYEGAAEQLRAQIAAYVSDFPGAEVEVEASEVFVDARDIDFYRYHRRLDDGGKPTIFVGASVHDVGGRPHLFVNYTGISPASGPGMVAAPPEGGIDMGPVAKLEGRFSSLSGLLMSAMMVYRGQTTEALMHLNGFLSESTVQGPIRWHARDQYAMRWGALGNYEEALWLVLEDEAVAAARGDERARLNAKGTRVRLYDFLDLQDQAYETARSYLAAREGDRPNSGYRSALSMFAEMAIQVDDMEAVDEAMAELNALCPEGCEMDMFFSLAGLYWASGQENTALQDELVAAMVTLGRAHGDASDMGAVRMYQGWNMMRDRNLEQGLIAFLEAQRLFEEARNAQGETRARYFIFMTQLARNEPQAAFDLGLGLLETYTETGEFEAAARVYERLMNLYGDIDFSGPPRAYLGAARRVLSASVQIQMARGDYGRASEALFTTGSFLFRINQVEEAQAMFQQAVWYGVQATRFDIVALSHLYLGMIARTRGDMEEFLAEVQRARLMAKTSKDAAIIELIENTISPPDRESDVPTKLL